MIPVHILKNGNVQDLRYGEVYETILEVCREHIEQQRAIAFAFILYNHENPHLLKILHDRDYWDSLDKISGNLLTVFHFYRHEENFGQELIDSDGNEKRGLHGISMNEMLIPMIKNHLNYVQPIKLPTILFFQTDGSMMIDYFFVKLKADKIEEGFLELKDYIKAAVSELENILPENYENKKEIFNILKMGVKANEFTKNVSRGPQNFPLKLFVNWLTSLV